MHIGCQVELIYYRGEVSLTVDYTHKQAQLVGVSIFFKGRIIIGSTAREGKSSIGNECILKKKIILQITILRIKYDKFVSFVICSIVKYSLFMLVGKF